MKEALRQLSKEELIALVLQLTEQVERVPVLEKRVEELEREVARLRKDSSNSSKPPSSDIVKPPKPSPPKGRGKRRIGGQRGHSKHERTPFAEEEIDDRWEYTLDRCPDCGGELLDSQEEPRVVQQVELIEKPVRVAEHRALVYWCPRCRCFHCAALPDEVRKGALVGPRLTALIGYLKGGCHMSYGTIQTYLRDVMGVTICAGQLAKVVGKVRDALAEPYDELRATMPSESRVNVDETGHKENGRNLWTWCFRAKLCTLFKIDPSRGSEVLIEVLGREFAGVIGADYFSAYRKYMGDFNVMVQFCLAHLIRDVKFLTTLPDKANQKYGNRLLERLRDLFRVIHRRETMSPARFQQKLDEARKKILMTAKHPPYTGEAMNMADRFRKHGDAYFRFITTPGVEPTNNLAEQALRFVVIDRRITQGTRGKAGREWCERIWSTIATCSQQGRSVFDFLCQAVHAHFTGRAGPSLLPEWSQGTPRSTSRPAVWSRRSSPRKVSPVLHPPRPCALSSTTEHPIWSRPFNLPGPQ